MKYGCLGEKLGHSYSPVIHAAIGSYRYDLFDVPRGEFDIFMKKRDFDGINVTIPYKCEVIPYLDGMSDRARETGAVNTIINRDGKLFGYNTDFDGMRALIKRSGMELKNSKVLIAGSGGTSKTAFTVARSLGASEVIRLSRNAGEETITYETAYEKHSDADFLINTTPVGMFPSCRGSVFELGRFGKLKGVIDAVYNPLRTDLLIDATERGIHVVGGLYMLVAQAVYASELFFGTQYESDTAERVHRSVKTEKENIVLTGMPGCGKSTAARIIAEKTGRKYVDTDAELVGKYQTPITELFRARGQEWFRDEETRVIESLEGKTGLVIATGGGAVLRDGNIRSLSHNGKIFFIDRESDMLLPSPERPLASCESDILRLYEQRINRYRKADATVKTVENDPHATAEAIIREFMK